MSATGLDEPGLPNNFVPYLDKAIHSRRGAHGALASHRIESGYEVRNRQIYDSFSLGPASCRKEATQWQSSHVNSSWESSGPSVPTETFVI